MAEIGSEEYFSRKREYYAGKVERFFARHHHKFESFVEDEAIIEKGDKLLFNYESAGYNFATPIQFPILGEEALILYSNYIGRTNHFAELLARMDNEKVIDEDDFSFGVKATKVVGYWGDAEATPPAIMVMKDGKEKFISPTVEGVVLFHPRSNIHAIDIARFLLTRARKDVPFAVEGSWAIPDARARHKLSDVLVLEGFKRCVANIYRMDKGNLIALKQESSIRGEGWKSYPLLINRELYNSLVDDDGDIKP